MMTRREAIKTVALAAASVAVNLPTRAAGTNLSPASSPVGPISLPDNLRNCLAARTVPLNQGWSFHRIENGEPALANIPVSGAALDHSEWEQAVLPHTVKVEPPTDGAHYFRGVCWYARRVPVAPEWRGRQVALVIDGAMQQAEVWINGKNVMIHSGGYLPFVIDLTPYLESGPEITVALCLDNNASAAFPPGSNRIDFCYWGGLYRPARLVVTDPVHISDPIQADKVTGGGIFVRYENVTTASADAIAQANIRNDGPQAVQAGVEYTLTDESGQVVARATVADAPIEAGQDHDFTGRLTVTNPLLWHPDHPNIYRLLTVVTSNGTMVDAQETSCGIRRLAYTDDGFFINGEKLVLRGANRHMAFPWLGNAASDNLQYRDIRLLKEGGFNFVRLAHYPQSSSTMAACDALGVLALVCTPGWQFFANTDAFKENARKNIREMIRWHRNHPSAVLWEVSLNETMGHDDFYAECCDVARAEYPGGQLFTSGDSSQSTRVRHYDLTYTGWKGFYHRPLHPDARIKMGLHREYGDYEFGGQASTTRVRRADGEEKLLLQAWNFQWSHNKNLSLPYTIGDAIWAGLDNVSSFDKLDADSHGHRSWWGALDLYRLPKFSYYFYQSQRSPDLALPFCDSGPMVRIAGYWTPRPSPTKVVVYSNCDEVELLLNGKSVARQKPDSGPDSDYGAYRIEADPMYWTKKLDTNAATAEGEKNAKGQGTVMFDGGNGLHLDHPPFTFMNVAYEPGELKAIAYLKEQAAAQHSLRTPGSPVALRLRAPELGRPWMADGSDAVFAYADVIDDQGEIVPDSSIPVRFKMERPARFINPADTKAEAGIASIILQAGVSPADVMLTAEADHLKSGSIRLRCG